MLSSESKSVGEEEEYVLHKDDAMSRQKTRIGTEVREIARCRQKGGRGRAASVTLPFGPALKAHLSRQPTLVFVHAGSTANTTRESYLPAKNGLRKFAPCHQGAQLVAA
jgi:hypothetical protein